MGGSQANSAEKLPQIGKAANATTTGFSARLDYGSVPIVDSFSEYNVRAPELSAMQKYQQQAIQQRKEMTVVPESLNETGGRRHHTKPRQRENKYFDLELDNGFGSRYISVDTQGNLLTNSDHTSK